MGQRHFTATSPLYEYQTASNDNNRINTRIRSDRAGGLKEYVKIKMGGKTDVNRIEQAGAGMRNDAGQA